MRSEGMPPPHLTFEGLFIRPQIRVEFPRTLSYYFQILDGMGSDQIERVQFIDFKCYDKQLFDNCWSRNKELNRG